MRIREVRKAKGKTLEELAVTATMTKTALCTYENGRSSTSMVYALFLRNEFGISFDWIYDGEMILKAHKPKTSKPDILNPIAIGLRLKSIRERFQCNKQEFGRTIGVTCQTIGQFEKGNMSPRIAIAQEIKRRYNKPLDWIYFGDEIIVPKSVARSTRSKKAAAEVVNTIGQLG